MGNPRERETRNGGRRVSRFAWRLERAWRALGLAVDNARVVVAVSGGADSTALLLAFDELCRTRRLKLDLVAAHLDHGLRADASREDSAWVACLAGERGIPLVKETADVRVELDRAPDNLEQTARRIRYDFLSRTACKFDAAVVLTGHTLDDQAETILLRLMRGSGLDGLSGIKSIRKLAPESDVLLVRPLLAKFRRAETVEYCANRGIEPRSDSMNLDSAFSRVRVRHELLPLLQTFNPRIAETLARTAGLIATDAGALEAVAASRLCELVRGSEDANVLEVFPMAQMPPGLRRRVLRQWLAAHRGDLRRIEEVHLRAIERLLEPGRGGRITELPGGGQVELRRRRLLFHHSEESK